MRLNVWRYLLVLWLTTTILAGSSMCCCTLAGLNAMASAGSAGDCCCPSSDSAPECPHPSNGEKHNCPCKNGKVASTLACTERVLSPMTPSSAIWQFSAGEVVIPFRVERTLIVHSTRFGSSAFPHLDRRGILRAVNSLRC